jgi:SOS-response transcriptional repressor LexA
MLILEIKGEGGLIHGDNRDKTEAKKTGTRKWIDAVNNAKRYGTWAYVFCDDLSQLRSQILAHVDPGTAVLLPFRHITPKAGDHFKTCVPLTTLRAAAGAFSEEQMGFDELVSWAQDWVTWDSHPAFEEGMFVARVQGKSMEPEIPDGAYCLFRQPRAGSREGRRVLVWHSGISDPLTGGHYTVKVYHSEKAIEGDEWTHIKIVLKPINADFEPIVLTAKDEGDVRVLAELAAVLPQPTRA